MEVIYGLLPAMLLLGLVGVAVFFWAVRSGQYDDMEGAAHRILLDDDAPQDPQSEDDKQDSDDGKVR
ncbi:MAG: cbb3-type cytochrome oxidase assembly protein CcoS [Methylophaga sp.]|nr:cbb3-type cytochrome oxidase assembly protein CcoS [Methylophaga sp.]